MHVLLKHYDIYFDLVYERLFSQVLKYTSKAKVCEKYVILKFINQSLYITVKTANM